MIRPAAAAGLKRWSEALAGIGIAAFGLWGVLHFHAVAQWGSGVIVLAGLALAWTGVQRARFRTGAGGPGVVQVTEGQLAYYGPFTGGAVALSEVYRLTLDPGPDRPCWRLSQQGQPDLSIPLDAEGAEQLFDLFAALPGLRTAALVAAVQQVHAGTRNRPAVIWDRSTLRLH
ncbi:hypothetical protein KM176_13425 [Pseudooceanicola sp. CBS1P-1]|uniref:Uncharacterized protein n=1 Tax=Pseudooceanicola albus TaxID=2692189 RepID=A0A6L7G297_9RHOB|nr:MULTISPECIES: hypothetical protein [Pseudooceanicola]MBT9384865.1 hypothetical protein [Pseudooceanicola endophyticus]MXN18141.1 hypothetical protein [Pseudooceanicola albus]